MASHLDETSKRIVLLNTLEVTHWFVFQSVANPLPSF